ncbi:tRNA-dihydrouridine synthase family protein [Candidatus Micrarchaeota archaeon]|jgi:tRNA-dihydrouridine synthase B|nr:tRNA-dihydrouridine synthase family protein [Candidatus Micrarchaeota archaeon]
MEKLILGSMDNYTDLPFRLLCQKYGANITITEMTNAIAIFRENEKTLKKIYMPKQEKKGYIQIMGMKNNDFYKGIKKIVELIDTGKNNSKGIDINFGCPSERICSNGTGSFLLKYPKIIKNIIMQTTKICPYPISCKLRLGYSKKGEIFDIIKNLNDTELESSILHGRTKIQNFSGNADWEIMKDARDKAKFTIYGNGDLTSIEQAQKKFKEGWKGVSIARAVRGNPSIFEGKKSTKKQFLEYFELAKKFNYLDLKKLKLHSICFEKNKQKKVDLSKAKTIEELIFRFSD